MKQTIPFFCKSLQWKESFWFVRKIVGISIGIDFLPNQIKLASWTCPVLFGFAFAYDGGGGPGNNNKKYSMNKYSIFQPYSN